MAIQNFQRKEIKFLLNTEQYENLKLSVQTYMSPDKFCQDGGTYSIFNVYYDTDDDYLIRKSLEKPYYKEKLRLRSYSPNTRDDERVFLEIKKKIGGIVCKRRVTLPHANALRYIKTGEKPLPSSYVQSQVFNELDAFFGRYQVKPKQYVSYVRSAWFAKDDPGFRLTFDDHIVTRRENLNLSCENYGELLIRHGSYLLEVKIKNSMPVWLANKLSELEIYKVSFSKYGMAYKKFLKSNLEPDKLPICA